MDYCKKTTLIALTLALCLTACATTPPQASPSLTLTPTLSPMPTDTPAPTSTPKPPSVTVETYTFYSQILNKFTRRTVDIFLPPGYSESGVRYKVLYAQDGQDMKDVHLEPTLNALYAENAIQPMIVVAIHATGERLSEYGTAGIPDYQNRGMDAGLYTRMLLEEVMPYINQTYRTQTGPANTFVMGWSLGGLMAFDLAWNHPDVFGGVGVFSGSLWWHTDNTDLNSMLASRIAHKMVRDGEKRPGMRFWFESGFFDEKDDRDGDGVIDSVQDTRELVAELKEKGYTDSDLFLLEMPRGYHGPGTWGEALPEFLKWAFALH